MEFVWVGLIVAAVVLDWLLVQWMRRQGRRPDGGAPAVYVFGAYSPFLSWLKSLLRPRRKPGPPSTAEIVRLMAAHDPAPGTPAPESEPRPLLSAQVPGAALPNLRPGLVWVAGGAGLAALSWMAVRPMPSDLALLGLLGAGAALLGAAGAQWPFPERGLSAVAGRLGVGPGQAACLLLAPIFALLAGLLSWSDASRSLNPWVANTAWAAAVGLVVAGGWQGGGLGSPIRWRVLAGAAALSVAALVVRGYDLTGIPVTLTGDEGSSGLSALKFVEGEADNLFGIGWHGFPALYFLVQSLPIAVLGRTIAAVRISSAVAGALTVGVVYLVGRSMFGRRAGLLAALLLASLHFHLHFSRIGLNNVWDGLSAVVVLGLAWHAWTSQRRAYFLAAGLALGLAQFFYPSARVLAAVLLAWFAVMGWRDRSRLRRLLPDLLLMAFVAVIAVLPLAMFFLRHPDEYLGPLRAVSLLGPILDSMVQSSGQSAWRVVVEQIGLGLGAFALTPIKFWYRPEEPILRALPAIFFWVGLVALVVRSRGGRGLLLGLWLLAFGLVGGLSESTPAAQRYVGAAAACSLVAAWGLVTAGVWVVRLWPRLARGVPALLLLTAVFAAVDDARFYYFEYTPQSRYGGSLDFEGLGAAVATRLAAFLRGLSPDWQVVFFGSPRMGYDSIPSLQYLAPHITGLTMNSPYGSPDNPLPSSERLVYAFLPDNAADLAAAMANRPGGWLFPIVDGAGQLILTIYQVPYPDDTAALEAAVLVPPPPQAPQVPRPVVFGAYALLVAVWAAWQWRRTQGAPARPPRLPQFTIGESRPALAAWLANLLSPAEPEPVDDAIAAASSLPPGEPAAPASARHSSAPAVADPNPGVSDGAQAAPPGAPAPPQPAAPQTTPAQPPEPSPVANPPPARSPRVAQVNVTLSVPPGARLRLHIDDISPDLPGPLPILTQELNAPDGQFDVPATVAVTFGPVSPPQPALPPAAASPAVASLPAPAAAPPLQASPAAAASDATSPLRQPPAWPAWALRAGAVISSWAARLRIAWRAESLALALFGGALLIYALTRLIGLDRFPIYFFSDEAVQTVQAADLVANGFRDAQDRLFPTYFQNGVYYNLSVSVYAQVLPFLLWGKSIFVTRAGPALLSLVGAAAVSLALRDAFRARWWWLGALLLAVTPAWFLHSRTAFETVLMVSFYAWFLYFYLLYRVRHPKFLLPALVAGALAFYSYAGGQMVIVLTGVLFGLSDLRYHWTHRQWAVRGLILLGVLVLPFIRFQLDQPGESLTHLRTLDSYWLDRELSLGGKLAQLAREYAFGLSPDFWFAADNHRDLVRHVMVGYGHLLPVTAPLLLLALVVCAWRARQAPYRAVLLALLAAPAGGALTAVGITRVLVLVVPAALLTALGLEFVRERLARRWRAAAGLGVFLLASVMSFAMLRDALRNGPVWSDDYGLGGMQWGVPELFDGVIPDLLAADPDVHVYLSPTWANGADMFPRFFLDENEVARFQMQGPDYYLSELRVLPPDHVVILLADEYERMAADPKIDRLDIVGQLPFPNGAPGYVFTRLAYSRSAAALFEAERATHLVPVTEVYEWDGQLVTVTHPLFGAGQLRDMLDGDSFTLINAPEANPVVLDFVFPAPRPVAGITLITGSLQDFTVTLEAYADPAGAPEKASETFLGLPPDPTVSLRLEGLTLTATRVRVTVQDNLSGADANIHIRELVINP